jgi:polysaccharide biosynthesis/export protein
MRSYLLAVTAAGLVMAAGPSALRAGDSKMYVVEPPDVLRLDVTGLPKKAQPVRGEFVVRTDGTVSLGRYGSVTIAGLTLDQTRAALTKHLSAHVKKKGKLQVRAEVSGYNSKVYYVIRSGKGGEQVYRFPAGGNETVVDAVLRVEGLSAAAANGRAWVASSSGKVREVDWRAITQEGRSATNYKLESGDRVYVGSSPPK